MDQERLQRVMAAVQRGDGARALVEAAALAAADAGNEALQALHATCLQQAGNLEQAERILTTLVQRHPGTWQHWSNLGNVQRAQGHPQAARSAYERALALQPQATRTRANLGLLLLNADDYTGAARHLAEAAAAPDAEPAMRVWAAWAQHLIGHLTEADAWLSGWQHWRGLSLEAQLELAWLLGERGQYEAALGLLHALDGQPLLAPRAAARRILMLERLNHCEQARQLLDAWPDARLGPLPEEARFEMLHARAAMALREDAAAAALQAADAALALAVRRGRTDVLYLRARALDRLDRPQDALVTLAQAHDQSPGRAPRPGAPAGGWLSWLLRRPAPGPVHADADAPPMAASPIFVVGFPRSGTTLVEQMLAAHPEVVSMDERPLLLETLQALPPTVEYPAALMHIDAEMRRDLRLRYVQRARAFAELGPQTRLVDKNPLNMLLLPLALWLFPHARVVHCVRHPLDAILSCHFQCFADTEVAAVSRHLPELARAFAEFTMRLRTDVRALAVAPQLFELRHETLIGAPEQTLERLAAFLGLHDVRAMLEYRTMARRRGYIATPSYAQVTQPLSARGIGRWRGYRAALAPLLPVLQDVMHGYDSE